ncbi:MAG: flagellar motor switch protein FliN [Deltaproteobacteria bacterium]|nr:MAG: flagellar motor switch protein FliN [Deltaproteobacteria bacterium]
MSEDVKDLNVEELKEQKEESGETVKREIEFILDIPVELTVVVGKTRLLIQELLQLTEGSIVTLDRMAGEMAEVYVNNRLLGRGEVVVVNDRFAVRMKDIVTPQERVRKLS